MTWFETLTSFPEESPEKVRANITVDGNSFSLGKRNVSFAVNWKPRLWPS